MSNPAILTEDDIFTAENGSSEDLKLYIADLRAQLNIATNKAKELAAERDALKGLEDGTHYRCLGCDVIYPFPCASTVGIRGDHVARFCAECTKDSRP